MTKPRPRSSARAQNWSPVRWKPNIEVEDVERDEAHAVSRVGRGGGLQRSDRARLCDPLLQNLSVDGLAVAEHQVRVHGLIELTQENRSRLP